VVDDLIAFVDQMDRCWVERRFSDLARYLASVVVFVAPGGAHRMHGIDAAVASYCEFMTRSTIQEFKTSGHVVTQRGPTAVIEYRWEMTWDEQGVAHEAKGREILVVNMTDGGPRVIWRTQLPG